MSIKALPTSTQGFIKDLPRVNQEKTKPKEKEICPICREDLEDKVTKTVCNHLFHPDCLAPWLKNNRTCPTCRYELIPAPAKPQVRVDRDQVDSEWETLESSGLVLTVAFVIVRAFQESSWFQVIF